MFYETLAFLSVLVQISPVSTNVLPVGPIFNLVDSQSMRRYNSNFFEIGFFEIETFDNFNDPFEFVVSKTLDNDFERSSIISSACQRDWGRIVTYSKSEVPKFWDSFAKTGTGIIEGRTTYLGQPEQCTNVKSGVMPVEVEDFPDTKPFLVAFNQNPTDKFVFTVGVCLPAECSTSDAMTIFQRLVNSTKQNPPSVVSVMEQPDIETSSTGFVVAWVAYSILLILVLVGTLLGISREALEYYQFCKILEETQNLSMVSNNENTALNWNEKLNGDVSNIVSNKKYENPSFWIHCLLCFDFHNNMKKILAIPTKTDSSQLKVLNGIRVMSMAWVVLGHTTLRELAVFDNVVYTLDKSTSLLFQTLTNATISVDTFFVLSGLLVMLGALRSLEKLHNPYNLNFWAMFYIHRLARLWPTMILGILFVFGFVPLMSKLTYSPRYQPYAPGSLIDSCEGVNDWAPTVFFYNNFVTIGASASLPCIDWTWYVASDMQFYILSPLVIIVVYKWRQVGSGVIGLLIFCSSLITLMMTAIKNIPPAGGSPLIGDPTAQARYSYTDPHWKNTIYFSSYCRFQTYGVGLLLGMALYDLKKVESLIEKLSLHLRIVLITSLWFLAVLLGIITIYGVYPTVNGHPMDRVASAFYNGTFRLLWAVAVSLVILLCSLGYGGIVNKFLSSSFWIPFARINYTTYIWHLFWLDVRIMAVEKFFRYSTIQFVLEASGCLALIFCSSVPIAAIVETPFINLQKLLLRRN